MKSKIIGYIVANWSGNPLSLGTYEKGDTPILLWGDKATIFATRSEARAAVRRTNSYAKRNKLNWSGHRIYPVEKSQ